MHLLVVWYLVNIQDARYNNKDSHYGVCRKKSRVFCIYNLLFNYLWYFNFFRAREIPLFREKFGCVYNCISAATRCSLIRTKDCCPIVVVAMRAVIFVLIASSSPLPRIFSPTLVAWTWYRTCTHVLLTRGFVNRTTLFPISPAFSITQQMFSGVMKSSQGCVLKSIAFLFQFTPFYLHISGIFNPRLCSPRISARSALSVRRPLCVYRPEIKSGWKTTGNIHIT